MAKRRETGRKKAVPKAVRRWSKSDTLLLNTDAPKYSDVLQTMLDSSKLKDLGAEVRTTHRSRTGDP